MQHRRSKKPLILGVVAIFAGALIFLLVKDIPAPSQPVEESLPAERFIKQ